MNNIILNDVKACVGNISKDDTIFNDELVLYINSALGHLFQIDGLNYDKNKIDVKTNTWADLLEDTPESSLIPQYVVLKVRLVFDTPKSSTQLSAINNVINELEYRISLEKSIRDYDEYKNKIKQSDNNEFI